jgi:hypothetical protein
VTKTYEFDLVALEGRLQFTEDGWEKAKFHLLEFQPAKSVALEGDPPSRIHVLAFGEYPEIAVGLLTRIEELAGARLRFELPA